MTTTRRRPRQLALGLLLVLCGSHTTAAQTPLSEDRVKAAFIYRFTDFVEWPAAALTEHPPITFCVAGTDRLQDELKAIAAGQEKSGHLYTVRQASRSDLRDCHVLFLSSVSGSPRPMLEAARELPILTVGDGERFLDEGGMIRLHVVQGRMRFDVATEPAQRVGLRLSSQLLRFALSVKQTP